MMSTNNYESDYLYSNSSIDNLSFEGNEPNNEPKINIIPISIKATTSCQILQHNNLKTQTTSQETLLNLSAKQKKNVLLLFNDNPNSNMKNSMRASSKAPRKNPKKCYYRMKIIRKFIKAIGKFLDKRNDAENMIADEFYDYLLENCECLKNFIEVDNQLTLRRTTTNKSKRPNFNDDFCKRFFSNNLVLEGFKKFLEGIFSDEAGNLCKMFGFDCCSENFHIYTCKLKWEILKIWSSNSLIGFKHRL